NTLAASAAIKTTWDDEKMRPCERPCASSRHVTRSTHELSVRLAALHHFLAVGIEAAIDDPFRGVVLVIVLEAEMPEAFGDGFEAGTFRLMIERVVGVGAVDDTA